MWNVQLSAFAFLLVGMACAPANETPAVDEAAVRQELTDRMNAYRNLMVAGDADAAMAYMTDDVRVLEAGVDLSGAAVGEFVRELFSTGASISMFETEPYDYFVHGDVAYEIGEYDETLVVGGEPQTVENYYFIRWEKGADGEWRFDRIVTGPRAAPEM